MDEEKLKQIEEYLEKNHILLAAAHLQKYAYAIEGMKFQEREIELCKKVASKFIEKKEYEIAEKLYNLFGLSKLADNLNIVEEYREIEGIEKRIVDLKKSLELK